MSMGSIDAVTMAPRTLNAADAQGRELNQNQHIYDQNGIQFQQEVNPVNALMVPAFALPAQHMKKLFKSVSRIAFSRHGQRHNDWLITLRIRLITKYRPAQRQYTACLT